MFENFSKFNEEMRNYFECVVHIKSKSGCLMIRDSPSTTTHLLQNTCLYIPGKIGESMQGCRCTVAFMDDFLLNLRLMSISCGCVEKLSGLNVQFCSLKSSGIK